MTDPGPMDSLRSRLNRILLAMLVLVFLAQWLMLALAIRRVSEDQMLTHLEHDRDSVVAALGVAAGGQITLNPSVIEPVYELPLSGHYYVVQAGGQTLFASRSHADGRLPVVALEPGAMHHQHATGPGGQSVLVLSRGLLLGGRGVTVSVAEDLGAMNEEIRNLTLAALAVVLPLLVAAVLMQNFGVRRALRPLGGIRDELRAIERGERDRIAGRLPAEIQPLVEEVNRLLAQLQRRLEQSRSATGNLAHTLKTPLTLLMRTAEDPVVPPAVRAALQEQVRLMHERIDRELKRARFAGAGHAGSLVNLHEEIPVLASLMQRVYADKHLAIDIDAPDQRLAFDREDMLELLGNLLDNACKWAATRVQVKATAGEQAGHAVLELAVADDGPGCAPDELDTLAQRGLRLDESRAGHGLGLAIARDLVEAYDGELEFDRDPALGGLLVRARLGAVRPGAGH